MSLFILTGYILKKICPSLSLDKATTLAAAFNKICPLYGINSGDVLHEFLANLAEETGEFKVVRENLNYSVDGLLKTFSRERISISQANEFGRSAAHPADQVAIANTIYGGEWGKKNLGNTQVGDGWLFIGRGAIQITGRANYQNFTNYYNARFGTHYTVEQIAPLLETDIEMSIHSAAWIFSIAFGLNDEAERDEMKVIVKKINGGYLNMPLRIHYLELAEKYIK